MPSRRQLVRSALVVAALSLSDLRNVLAVEPSVGPPWDEPPDVLTWLTTGLTCSERLGRACLRALADHGIASSDLAQLVVAELELQPNDHSARDPREAARRRIRQDFEQRNIVDVDGWCLSRTETSLYALAFLQRQRGLG